MVDNVRVHQQYPLPLPLDPTQLLPADGVETDGVDPDERIISCAAVTGANSENFNIDDTFLMGIMLRIKMGEKSLGFYSNRNNTSAAGASGNKLQKTGGSFAGSKLYDRLLTFADVSEPGKCFALVCAYQRDSTAFFKLGARLQLGVGTAFLIREPLPSANTLGSSDSAISLLEYYNRNVIPLKDGVQYLPRSPLVVPRAGETRYFCYHNVTNIVINGVTPKKSICGGQLCDRQQDPKTVDNKSFKCGCQYVNNRILPKVLGMRVTVPCETTFHNDGMTVIPTFHSHKTTKLFIQQTALDNINLDKDDMAVQRQLRQSVNHAVEYINSNGGFTVVGWLRTGKVGDEGNPRGETDQSSLTNVVHLTYLMPSNLAVVDMAVYQNEHIFRGLADEGLNN
jgi:hypothetical protein